MEVLFAATLAAGVALALAGLTTHAAITLLITALIGATLIGD